jgi:hypothetical protein
MKDIGKGSLTVLARSVSGSEEIAHIEWNLLTSSRSAHSTTLREMHGDFECKAYAPTSGANFVRT